MLNCGMGSGTKGFTGWVSYGGRIIATAGVNVGQGDLRKTTKGKRKFSKKGERKASYCQSRCFSK